MFDSNQKIQSTLIENTVETDSLLVPNVYWDRLNFKEKRLFGANFPFY
ncbi:hypothetical protein LEP1GSC128_1154 [Leptospira borgpetersenii str. 200801926]|uniref:Uncharacterized protein n=1 Tax=Leptospira borgpetersenii str. 200801926 TaxID=1193009 RepID=A0ABN0HSR2_LEPBO|nr:hypothetical protein LEP1GSC128_1154 [Leptospira borgpetersenii str. 200801926]